MPTTSKVSFDTLSDPNPPTPGASERAAVNARAGTLARRRRFAQGAGALACTVVIGLGVVALVNANGSPSGTGKVETAGAPQPGTKASEPTVAPATVAPAVTAPADDSAAAPAADAVAPPSIAVEEPAPAVAALASVTVSIDGVPDGVTLNVTLVGANGTFSTSVRTPGSVSFADVPPGDYQVRWDWSSDDGTATAVGRNDISLAGGANNITIPPN